MNKRRIDLYIGNKLLDALLVVVTENSPLYFIASDFLNFKRSLKYCNDGTIKEIINFQIELKVDGFSWKPHEYWQQTRESCLYAYWYLKRRLGRDIAGIIAKFVWSTRFDYCWENEEED